MTDRGQAMIEAAFILPLLLLVVIGGTILGVAVIDDIRLERAASDAARLEEPQARQLIRSVGGTLVCYSETGECYDDGLTMERIQVVAEGRTWVYPTGSVTPMAYVSRPKEGTK
jgi:hypothetical protein